MFHFYVLLSLPWSVTGKEHFYSLSASFATLSFALTALSGFNIIDSLAGDVWGSSVLKKMRRS
jgi:hypothetical protein